MVATQWFIDYQNGSDSTGNGTSGNPYKTLKHLMTTHSHDTTNGDDIVMSGNVLEVLTESISTTVASNSWAPTNQFNQVTIRGAAGSATGFDGNATYSSDPGANFTMANLELRNSGTAAVVADATWIANCVIHNNLAQSSSTIAIGRLVNCYIYNVDCSSTYLLGGGFGQLQNCIVDFSSASGSLWLTICSYNAILLPGNGVNLKSNADHARFENNTFYYKSSATTNRIGLARASSSREYISYRNNLIVFETQNTGDVGLVLGNEDRGDTSNNAVLATTAYSTTYSGAFFQNETLSTNPFSSAPTGANDWSEWEPSTVGNNIDMSTLPFPQVIPRYKGAWQPTPINASPKHPLGRF